MSTSLLWGIKEDITKKIHFGHWRMSRYNKQIEAVKGILGRGDGLRKNIWSKCGKDSIRISDFSSKDSVVSDFLLKVP